MSSPEGQPRPPSPDTVQKPAKIAVRPSRKSILMDGFTYLSTKTKSLPKMIGRGNTDSRNKGTHIFSGPDPDTPSTDPHLTINFIDPSPKNQPPAYFNLVSSILAHDFENTLHSVPYQSMRSNTESVIDSLFLTPILSGMAPPPLPPPPPVSGVSQFTNILFNKFNSEETPATPSPPPLLLPPSQSTPSSSKTSSSDPTEWHSNPFCHVYLAPCDSLDHYKNKIRPSLQAFVSQIEASAATGGTMNITSSQYVIVFIPGGKNRPVPQGGTEETKARGFIRDASARLKGRSVTNNWDEESSVGSTASNNTRQSIGTLSNINESNAIAPNPLSGLTHREKELFKKLNIDFPNGKLCVLSTLFSQDTNSPLSQSEWITFLSNLGGAIVSSFRERYGRYDELLRKINNQGINNGSDQCEFDLANYCLIKEGLAFTLEQMQLPAEALLQYQELSAFITSNVQHLKVSAEREEVETEEPEAFRECLRQNQVTEIQLHHYLFIQEIRLLFRLNKPVEVLQRSHFFVVLGYKMKLGKSSVREAEMWALETCWEVKQACESYFSFKLEPMVAPRRTNEKILGVARGVGIAERERDAARQMSELLEFARLRLLKLGDLNFDSGESNPIRMASVDRPLDTYEKWVEWENLVKSEEVKEGDDVDSNQKDCDEKEEGEEYTSSLNNWLPPNTFTNKSLYISKYHELIGAIIALYQHAGRHRSAARLQNERAEILILQKKYSQAVSILKSIVEVCAKDQWDKLHYWRLFRLACCHRMTKDACFYLRTLVKCFTPHLKLVAPKKTYGLLQTDLEALVQEKEVEKVRLGVSAFLETELSILDSSTGGGNNMGMGKSAHPLRYLRKKWMKYVFLVGDTMDLGITITSHLPRPITVDTIRLYIVTLDEYENVYKRSSSAVIDSRNAYRILTLHDQTSNIQINPGQNKFSFQWIPMAVGQFLFASVEIQWNKVRIFHDSASLRRSIPGVEVLPSEPTHSIELNPLFLIPGEEQEVRLVFKSGKDIITKGMVELICSRGLTVLTPNKSSENDDPEWKKSCTVDLDPLKPGEDVLIKTMVRSDSNTNGSKVENKNAKIVHFAGEVQTLHAKVITSYHHSLYHDLTSEQHKQDGPSGEEIKSPPMTTELEAMVTTLDRPALTTSTTKAFALEDKKVIVSAAIFCNTPIPFSIKEWKVSFPPPLVLEEDFNDNMFGYPVVEGTELFFGFKCRRLVDYEEQDANTRDRPFLEVVLKDDFGKTFRQVLGLDLDTFYEQMKEQDEYNRGVNIANAVLSCPAEGGVVNSPVNFNFHVEITEKNRKGEEDPPSSILYSISCNEETDWILGGRTRGVIQDPTKGFTLEFVGIPTHSGVLKRFPEIELRYVPSSPLRGKEGDGASPGMVLPPILVYCRFPDSFRSLSFTNHMALACPSGLEVPLGH